MERQVSRMADDVPKHRLLFQLSSPMTFDMEVQSPSLVGVGTTWCSGSVYKKDSHENLETTISQSVDSLTSTRLKEIKNKRPKNDRIVIT